ncbi:MAG: MDR/zinc-dependent alcohol dehydrogenase-like family protein [Phycisphaeraceae bacterium]
MKAATIVEPGSVRIDEVPLPEPGEGQVRVELEGCGVCSSNVPPYEGRAWFEYPMEPGGLGHEGWGVVHQLGPGVQNLRVGDRIAFISDHAYAEYDLADADAAVKLPGSLRGRAVPGEPLGCAMNIFERSGIEKGQTVAIIGIGFLGAILTRLARLDGARVLAISRRESSLETASRMGAAETIPMKDHGEIIEQVREMTGGAFCDVVIEATGKQWPLDLAAELTKIRGRLVVAGYHQDGPRQVNMQLWNWRGLDVINAHERDPAVYKRGIEHAVEALAEGRLDPSPLYTHELPLERLGEALEMTRTRPEGFVKALVRPARS